MDIKQNLRDAIRESIDLQIVAQKPLNESLLLALGAGAILGWAQIRKFIQNMNRDKMIAGFFETYDSRIKDDIERVYKKFNLVKSLADLDTVEREIKTIQARLETLIKHSANFDLEPYLSSDVARKAFALNKDKMRREFSTAIQKIVSDLNRSFNIEVEIKKEQVYQ